MQLTRQADYALRAIIYLTLNPQARIQEIAQAQYVPKEYLAKIIQKLARAEIVTTHRGVGGGIALSRTPEDITMLEVIEAIEGPVALNRCIIRPGECPRESYCGAHMELENIGKSLAKMLANVNFAQLALNEASLSAGMKNPSFDSDCAGEM